MRYQIRLLLLASMIVAACSTGSAAEPSPMRKATKTPWPIKWYIPPEEGPVVGNQNGWFVTPQDILPGAFTLSGKVDKVTGDSFEMTPNSVWGEYRFKITRTGPIDQPSAAPKLRSVVSVRDIHFTDLSKLADENTLLFAGTLKTIGPDRRSFTAEIEFNDGPLICRLDLIDAEEKAPLPDIRSMHYGPHWQHTSYYWADNVKCEEPRYDGWSGTRRFVCDHMGVPLTDN